VEKMVLSIDGMSCGHCVARVNKALTAVPGVKVEKVDIGSATLEYDPARATVAAITAALDEAGYPVRSAEGQESGIGKRG
jgi:copper chaperone CopZ